MKYSKSAMLLTLGLVLTLSPLYAGKYYVLCEGNFGQANASLWSIDESLQSTEGPLIWNASSNPLGDVGQSLTLFEHTLYIVMNGSHEVRVVDLESGDNHSTDIELPGTSPRFMAVDPLTRLGYISSWTLGALVIVDLEGNAPVDTFFIDGLPEQMLIVEDEMFVTIPMKSDWSATNKVLRIDLSGSTPAITHTYEVIDGPGALTLMDNQIYVTSLYYNDAWETFTGTSKLNLLDHTVETLDHGIYTNFTADLDIIDGKVYRTFGASMVPLNEDLTVNSTGALGNISGIYSHTAANNHILIGSSDFVAPDLVTVLSLTGQELASFNVGALPSQILYYSPEFVSTESFDLIPTSFSMGTNYPNPFNPTTMIPFSLEHSGDMSLRIFDITGKIVASLFEGYSHAGEFARQWDGRNDSGTPVSSGIYHAVLTSKSQSVAIKINLLK